MNQNYSKQTTRAIKRNSKFSRQLILLITCCCLFVWDAHAQGTWARLNDYAPDYNGGVMLLMSDGTVICHSSSGGPDGYGSIFDRLTPDANGSYINGTWSQIAPMIRERYAFSSVVLKDGRVYAAGGEYGTDGTQAGSHGEVYDPATNKWTACNGPNQIMSDGDCKMLDNGTVIQAIVDHYEPTSTVIYNPATNQYTTGPSTNSGQNESMWLKLPDNSILFVDEGQQTSERYIPSLNKWVVDGHVPVALYDPFGFECGPAFMLPNGKAFFIGSTGHTSYYTPSGTSSAGVWTAGPDIPDGMGMPDAPGAMMVNGKILIACSTAPSASVEFATPTYFYEFNYLTNSFSQVNAPGGGTSIDAASQQCSFLDLPDGTVLFALNQDFSSDQYYVYIPDGTPVAAGKPVIANLTSLTCTSYRITGKGFNGISEGASFGDENQSDSNYPLIRLVSGNKVYYAHSYNWNSTGVQRGNAADTVYFSLPAGLPNAAYSLVVVANGNASDTVSLAISVPTLSSSLSATICSGNSFTYTPSSTTGGATYTWTRAAVAGISNAAITTPQSTNPNEVLINTSGTPVTAVYAYVISAGGCNNTVNVSVVVNAAPVAVVTANGSTTICSGNSVTLNSNTGTGYTYQWKKNGGNIAGASSSAYAAASADTFTCVITNGCGSSTSNKIVITITGTAPPSVISAGGPTNICSGSFVTLSANTGTGLLYQWRLNGANISGAASSSYNATLTGNYTCFIGNSCGNKLSDTIAVNVVGRNTLVLQPNAANGVDALVDNLPSHGDMNFGTIGDFNAEAWTVSSVPFVSRSFIRFDLNTIPVTATVQQALLTLYNNPTSGNIGGQHSNSSGSDVSWIQKVTASWNENTITWNNQPATSSTNEVVVPQSTSGHEDYTLDVTALVQGMVSTPSTNYGMMIRLQTEAYYRGLIFASSDNADSTKWPKLSITYNSVFISALGATTICQGDTAHLTVSITDTTNSYQWQLNGANISGAIAPAYAATAAGSYKCVVVDSCGSTPSANTIVVTVNTVTAAITTSSTTVCASSPALLTANTGTGLNYQWQLNGVDIPGATNYTYSTNQTGSYTCVVSNATCRNVSNIISIAASGITTTTVLQPNAADGVDAFVFSTNLHVNTNYATDPDFDVMAWTFGGVPGTVRSFIRFELGLIPVNAAVSHAFLNLYYNPTTSNGQDSNQSGSDAAWIQKVTAPWREDSITWNNQPATTSANEVLFPQSTSATEDYTIDIRDFVQDMVSNPASNYGVMIRLQTESYYRKLVFASSDNADSTKWPKLTVTYSVPLVASINADGPASFCSEGNVTLHADASPAGTGYTYQWKVYGTDIPNATDTTYLASAAGNYECVVTDSCGSAPSNIITVTVNANPSVPVIQLSGNNLCVNGFGANYKFQWQFNGVDFGTSTSCVPLMQIGAYTIIVTDTLTHCQSASLPFIATGLNDFATGKFKVYPNPTNGIITIDPDFNNSNISSVKVFDVNGRVVYELGTSLNKRLLIDLSQTSKGIYLLQINSDNTIYSLKLVID